MFWHPLGKNSAAHVTALQERGVDPSRLRLQSLEAVAALAAGFILSHFDDFWLATTLHRKFRSG